MQPKQPTTLLLVEDEAIIALAERRTLERNGYTVALAHSGEEAVSYVCEHPDVDLILMDIDLGPGIDGTEASRRILELRDVPIAFLTSHTEPDYVDRVKQITGYGYVVKSSGEFVLLESIDMALKLWAAHRQSQEEKERYRLITENMSETVLTVDREFRVDYVSPSIERLTGFTPEEYRRMPLGETLTEESVRAVTELARRQGENPAFESSRMELERRCKDGTTVLTETTSTPIVSDDGEVVGFVSTIRDVRGRRETESAFRAVYDQTEEAIGVFDEDGRFLQVNRAAAAMLGLKPSDVRGRVLQDVYPEPFAGRAMAGMRTVFESGRSRHAEWKTEIDGETRWFLVHIEPNTATDGTVPSVTTFSTDITGLKQTQEAYQLIAEHASDVVGVLDEELRPIYLSPSAERLFGYKEQDFESQSIFAAVHKDDAAGVQRTFEKAIRERSESVRDEFRLVTASGEVRWVELTATHLYAGGGELDRIVMAARDITARNRLEARLRATTSRLEATLDAMPELVFELDDELRFREYRRPAHRDLYVPPGDFLGRSIDEVLPPEAADRVREAVTQISNGVAAPRVDYSLPGEDGQRSFRASVACHGGDASTGDDSLRYVVVVHDVTDFVRALERNRWLIREVHHRIKNNLSIISSLIFLTEENLPDGVDLSDLRNQIEAVRFAHEQLQSASDEQAVDVGPYLHGLLSSVFASSPADGVSLRVEAEGVTLPGRQAVSVGLIANELASNARKHGFIEDGDRSFTIALTAEGAHYVLTARNSGRPFPDDVDPYSATTLGLQLVVNLTQQLGGELELVRRPQPVFTIRFPSHA